MRVSANSKHAAKEWKAHPLIAKLTRELERSQHAIEKAAAKPERGAATSIPFEITTESEDESGDEAGDPFSKSWGDSSFTKASRPRALRFGRLASDPSPSKASGALL